MPRSLSGLFISTMAQSYIKTTDNDFFGNSENGSWEFKELGINGLWRPADKLQLVVRDAGKTDDGDLRVDYGFVDYTLMSSDAGNSGLRLGRVVNPYGLYNDTRDIAATRPSILLPQSVYFDVNRNFALSSDGLQYYHEYSTGSGDYFFSSASSNPVWRIRISSRRYFFGRCSASHYHHTFCQIVHHTIW